jgi:hypothetical protein
LAIRARWTAEALRVEETRAASWGRTVGRREKGGLESRRAIDSGESDPGGRRRRSRSGAGSSWVREAAWAWD